MFNFTCMLPSGNFTELRKKHHHSEWVNHLSIECLSSSGTEVDGLRQDQIISAGKVRKLILASSNIFFLSISDIAIPRKQIIED